MPNTYPWLVLIQLNWVIAAVIVARTRQRKNVVQYAKRESVLQVGNFAVEVVNSTMLCVDVYITTAVPLDAFL